MFDLQLLNKANEVEKQTGQSLPSLLSQVPLGNVLTAFKELQISDLVEMVNSVPVSTLVHGLTIITSDEISQISHLKYYRPVFLTNINAKILNKTLTI